MNILVIGNGGREHAMAWKLRQSTSVKKVYVAPGNAGTANEAGLINVPLTDLEALAKFASTEQIDLTVVGPEMPLAAGIVDLFQARGLTVFGPSRRAAQLESSKEFSKAFMQRHGIPTARYASFSDSIQAHQYIDTQSAPIVIKAEGMASGKGVIVAQTIEMAHRAVDILLGRSKTHLIIEEYLEGEEASFIVMANGHLAISLASSQDHKRLLDQDLGPNTGGMGAYSPAPIITPALHQRIMQEIITPTLKGLIQEGLPYTGFLYAGLMIDPQGNPNVLEFNCRLGDPEAQVILMRLRSDFVDLIEHVLSGQMMPLDWDPRVALNVVLAAKNYPEKPRTQDPISGIPNASEHCRVFHAATTFLDHQLVTSGGRVLNVASLADSVRQARSQVYTLIKDIHFDGMQYRTDIGHLALDRLP